MVRISISGTHCTGKSTILDSLKEKYKKNGRIAFIEGPTRQLKDLGYPINNDQASNYDSTQLMCCHLDLEHLKKNKYLLTDEVISDRCLFDTLIYTRYLYQNGKVSEPVMRVIESAWGLHKSDYDIILMPSKDDIKLVGDKYRNTDGEFRETIHNMFIEEAVVSNLNCHLISGTTGERVEQIKNLVKLYHEIN